MCLRLSAKEKNTAKRKELTTMLPVHRSQDGRDATSTTSHGSKSRKSCHSRVPTAVPIANPAAAVTVTLACSSTVVMSNNSGLEMNVHALPPIRPLHLPPPLMLTFTATTTTTHEMFSTSTRRPLPVDTLSSAICSYRHSHHINPLRP